MSLPDSIARCTGVALMLACMAANATTYRVTPMAKEGWAWGWCTSMNRHGTMVGNARVGNDDRAWRASSEGKVKMLSQGNAPETMVAQGINASRQIAGHVIYDKFSGLQYAATWAADGTITKLATLAEGDSAAYDLNDAGDIVGEATTAHGELHAVMWADGQIIDLAPGHPYSDARAINARRQAVGSVENVAALFEDGQVKTLGTLGGRTSYATDVNAAGHVVGSTSISFSKSYYRAFWYADGVMHDIGAPPKADTTAYAVNRHDVVVGMTIYRNAWPRNEAFVWRNGRRQALNDLLDPVTGAGWHISSAHAINDDGVICGSGNGGAVLLTPMD